MNRLFLLGTLLLLVLSIGGCVKDQEEIIPNVHFTGQINYINQDPLFLQKQSFIVQYDSYGKQLGLYGVVIYNLGGEYYVFDRMCPYEKDYNSLVNISEVDGKENYGYCTCPTCGTQFSVNSEYGGVIEGVSKWPLKRYNAEVQDDGTLYIWN